ncbi:HAMP domain-containing sensor histidine kinase [Bacteroides helcogenes]|uniref:histidine kinase n=1 Tax=Bacteroides helcogenes (strain ATCC 35417 / DSM 20613 / JCM 6297 / CCUG 15421 / P 36-108) TaxID=693979 RepID=E6SV19_BACT6|nr:HAMP domain-containing sensor histidine kinase [Bacteroides helcogenes]ADV43401.1 histidine kinase [Bacteroides helcogenes P 36-108]MDY5238169.1 HAMP domain-containing sensor histidine kinase [Bacteroides helcogenes]
MADKTNLYNLPVLDENIKNIIPAILDLTPIGVGLFSEKGDIVYCNKKLEENIRLCNRNAVCNIKDSLDIPQDVRHALSHGEACLSVMYFDIKGNVLPQWEKGCTSIQVSYSYLTAQADNKNYFLILSKVISEEEDNRNLLIESTRIRQEQMQKLEEANKTLHNAIKQNKLILDNINSSLIYLKPDYTVVWKNSLGIYGDQKDKMYRIGTHCYEHFGKNEPCDICPVKKAHEDHLPKFRTFFDPSGLSLDVNVVPIVGEDNTIEGYLMRLDDVSNREKMIKELREAKQTAEASERAKMAFLANMSHEVRTPLNAIVGFVELLNSEAATGMGQVERDEYVNIIKSNVELLTTLVNDILDHSRLAGGYYMPAISEVDVEALCRNVLETVRERVPAGVELLLDIAEDAKCLKAQTDAQRVQQLLINFLTNACKYTAKGSITLGLRKETAMGGILLHFQVTDTGVGIPKEKGKVIFERFEKLNDFKQGTGLGLSICRLIADVLHGNVYLDEHYTSGARFVFELPLDYKE